MQAQINMIGIITDQFETMKTFYTDVLGFQVKLEMPNYVEFEQTGVRFAISTNAVMHEVTSHKSYTKPATGQRLELAFKEDTAAAVDTTYAEIVEKRATPITPPADMPWGQRAAFFADPDGNIHELFTDI